MIKTNKRHVIPLTEPAIHILRQWQEKREGCRYVFNLVKENLELDDEEETYCRRCLLFAIGVVKRQNGIRSYRR